MESIIEKLPDVDALRPDVGSRTPDDNTELPDVESSEDQKYLYEENAEERTVSVVAWRCCELDIWLNSEETFSWCLLSDFSFLGFLTFWEGSSRDTLTKKHTGLTYSVCL